MSDFTTLTLTVTKAYFDAHQGLFENTALIEVKEQGSVVLLEYHDVSDEHLGIEPILQRDQVPYDKAWTIIAGPEHNRILANGKAEAEAFPRDLPDQPRLIELDAAILAYENGEIGAFLNEQKKKAASRPPASSLLEDENQKATLLRSKKQIPFALGNELKGYIETGEGLGLAVHVDGYSDNISQNHNGTPIYIEMYEGCLRAVLYSDINQEDPTHVISLENAKIDNRF
ncbi:hypothetical protein [Alteromonas sp. 14N.309.X.WAT.G.H12]|uniref:hypothetical protein n=1 Tax=Alteromonas sp. 14N.309.X.WAT.G.H12 TaxID=3120824 RepID=UPI002FD4543F